MKKISARIFNTDEEAVLEVLSKKAEEFEESEKKSIFKHRFSDASWFNWLKGRDVIVLGAGGIGSWVIFALGRIGCNLHVYDMDTIESHNLGGQLYSINEIGQNKAEAISNITYNFSGKESTIRTFGYFNQDSMIGPIVISCFDNMTSRKLAFEKWKEALEEDKENEANYLFIDGRLLAEDYQVYGVTNQRLNEYAETLFEDGEIEEVMCSLKSTTHCSMSIAGDIVGLLTNFAANRAYDIDAREVPFSIVKNIPFFSYKINF